MRFGSTKIYKISLRLLNCVPDLANKNNTTKDTSNVIETYSLSLIYIKSKNQI